jgi:hypothetical protein
MILYRLRVNRVIVASLVLIINQCFMWATFMRADTLISSRSIAEKLSLNPCFDVSDTVSTLPDGTKQQAIRIACGGAVSYSIPPDARSFHIILERPAVGAKSTAVNPARVRVLADEQVLIDTVLGATTPPEVWDIPLNGARKLTIRLDTEYWGEAVLAVDARFSNQTIPSVNNRHILSPGAGYANIGTLPRQLAFFSYFPRETVPMQVEVAGHAETATVNIRIVPHYYKDTYSISLTVPLQSSPDFSLGKSKWNLPSFCGPADLTISVLVAGRKLYEKNARIAIFKPVNLTEIKSSNFGVHISSSGTDLLEDDFASLWGAKWARVFLRWELIEAQQGSYNWTMVDALLNSYLEQHFLILGVLGQVPPKWVTPAQLPTTYTKFVKAAVEHFRGKISYWDVYNEIDVKFSIGSGFDRNIDPQGDIKVLRQEMEAIRQFDPALKKVCCSTGERSWLQYDKRIFDAGLLNLIDIVSMHPYQTGPPEYSNNGMTYPEMVQRLDNLASSYGAKKPIWSTEANWLIGPAGTPGVTAPDVTEHQQSQYVVRVNLLSLGMHVPYFVHSPFFTGFHRDVLVDSLSSYAAMASILSDAQDAKVLQLTEGIYGVSASAKSGTVLALWSTRPKGATVHISGLQNTTIQDIYGNSISHTDNPTLSESPIYITGTGTPLVSAAPAGMRAMVAASSPQFISLAPVQSWSKGQKTQVQNKQNGVHALAAGVKYDNQLVSPVFSVSPNSCYIIRPELIIYQGGVGVVVTDPDTHQNLRSDYMYAYTGKDKYDSAIRIQTQNHTHLQIIVQAGNANGPANTEFDLNHVQVDPCQ